MTSHSSVMQTERTKLLYRPMTWILAIILVGIIVMLYVSLTIALLAPDLNESANAETDQELRELVLPPDGFSFALNLVGSFGAILLIILAAGSFGSEFSWGTVRTALLIGASRRQWFIAKLLTLEAIALLVALFGAVVGSFAPIAVSVIVSDTSPLSEWLTAGYVGDATLMVVRTFIAIAMWVLIASSITLITHSLAAGAGITLGLNIAGGLVLSLIASTGRVGTWFARLFPNEAIGALTSMNQSDPPSYTATDYAWITTNLAVYTVVLIAIAIIRFRRMNILAASTS